LGGASDRIQGIDGHNPSQLQPVIVIDTSKQTIRSVDPGLVPAEVAVALLNVVPMHQVNVYILGRSAERVGAKNKA
jgi:hypothetical protein